MHQLNKLRNVQLHHPERASLEELDIFFKAWQGILLETDEEDKPNEGTLRTLFYEQIDRVPTLAPDRLEYDRAKRKNV